MMKSLIVFSVITSDTMKKIKKEDPMEYLFLIACFAAYGLLKHNAKKEAARKACPKYKHS